MRQNGCFNGVQRPPSIDREGRSEISGLSCFLRSWRIAVCYFGVCCRHFPVRQPQRNCRVPPIQVAKEENGAVLPLPGRAPRYVWVQSVGKIDLDYTKMCLKKKKYAKPAEALNGIVNGWIRCAWITDHGTEAISAVTKVSLAGSSSQKRLWNGSGKISSKGFA